MSSWPANRSVLGRWPMATNRPVTVSSTWRRRSRCRARRCPDTSVVADRTRRPRVFQRNSIFGLANGRSCMILEARSSSRRCTIVTVSANLVRNVASSRAESPPPTTAMSWSRKKKPSQVAHVDRPWPISRASAARPSISDCAPVATMTASARDGRLGGVGIADPHLEGRLDEVDLGDLLRAELGAEARGLVPHACHELGAHDAVREAGEVLHLGGEHELAAGLVARRRGLALEHQRARGWPGRCRSRPSGRPGRSR